MPHADAHARKGKELPVSRAARRRNCRLHRVAIVAVVTIAGVVTQATASSGSVAARHIHLKIDSFSAGGARRIVGRFVDRSGRRDAAFHNVSFKRNPLQ
jgi:hypothetical protein